MGVSFKVLFKILQISVWGFGHNIMYIFLSEIFLVDGISSIVSLPTRNLSINMEFKMPSALHPGYGFTDKE